MQPDANACFGSGVVRVCLGALPAIPLTLGGTSIPLNTDMDCPQVVTQPGGGTALCVYAGTTITVPALLFAIGTRPLVLVATDAVVVKLGGTINVSSTLVGRRRGAGATGTPCSAASNGVNDSGGGGGGAGGSFGTLGGAGGIGDTNNNGLPDNVIAAGGTPSAPITVLTALRGGCSGGTGGEGDNSDGSRPGGVGGDGGGAVALIAGHTITIGGDVFASGAGGGSNPAPEEGEEQGGGGGGPGGLIYLDAPQIQIQQLARVVANGGAGGGGGGGTRGGSPGGDGTTAMWDKRARGGNGDGAGAGTGADGTALGVNSDLEGEDEQDGGGGGAGGLGLIWTYGTLQRGPMMSPAPTTH
jgi:hypothetical protein